MSPNTPEYTESELPAVELFQKLGWTYMEASGLNPERRSIGDVILTTRLEAALKRMNPWLNDNSLKVAIRNITRTDISDLLHCNQTIHKYLSGSTFSVTQSIQGKEQSRSIHYIDYQHMDNNDFLVVNQATFKGRTNNSKPDLVAFINGLPIAVIECKSPTRQDAAFSAIEDLLHYQENTPSLFMYNQVCAAVYQVGAHYGPILAQHSSYHIYRTQDTGPITQLIDREATHQDILIYHLFKKEFLLDLIRNFIVFEHHQGKLTKILPRYPQIRAVNKAIEKLKTEDKGGVIWHTQGSGKSLSMIYLATKLRRIELGFDNPTIIVMTDRLELDSQIHDKFSHCGFPNPIRARSINDLADLLRDNYGKTIMTTIQKFQESLQTDTSPSKRSSKTKHVVDPNGQIYRVTVTEDSQGNEVETLRQPIEIPELSTKRNLFVFVDEAHRTQYGFLAAFMRKALPHARFFAFTGTPISKENKSTLAEFYGGHYLDVYPIKQSVEDGATLPIYYDTALPHLHIPKDLIDIQLAKDFPDAPEEKQEKIRQKASRIDTLLDSAPRIREITQNIVDHYKEKIYPQGFKAMIVCNSREAAANYKLSLDSLALEGKNPFQSKLIISIDPKRDPESLKKLATPGIKINQTTKNFTLPFPTPPSTPSTHTQKKNVDNTAFLIVCDMLLTGYDAPLVQAMYLDKILKEHNLVQAIARVNRTQPNKTAGFIIDYCGITQRLSQALTMFADDLNPSDIMETPTHELNRLQNRHYQLIAFFNSIKPDRNSQRKQYIDQAVLYLQPENRRFQFKQLLSNFNTSMDILLPSPTTLPFHPDFKIFNEIKFRAANMFVDNPLRLSKAESLKIQQLVDLHLKAEGIQYLLESPISIIDHEKFSEEINRSLSIKSSSIKRLHRTRHIIETEMNKNPGFYKPLWERIKELIDRVNADRIQQASLFSELDQIDKTISDKLLQQTSLGLSSDAQFAVYKNLEPLLGPNTLSTTLQIFDSIAELIEIHDWKNKESINRDIRTAIKKILKNQPTPGKQKLAQEILERIRSNT